MVPLGVTQRCRSFTADVGYGGGEQLYPGREAKVQDDGSYGMTFAMTLGTRSKGQVAREMIEAACSAGS